MNILLKFNTLFFTIAILASMCNHTIVFGQHIPDKDTAHNYHWWQANNAVNAIAVDSAGRRIFIGGNFSYVGPGNSHGVSYELKTQEQAMRPPRPNNTVRVSIPDGQHGWFIGGHFNKVGDSTRIAFAHIKSNGDVGSLVVDFNLPVRAMGLDGDVLYIGGDFTMVNSKERERLAAVNIVTGEVLPWNPGANGSVHSMAVSDNTVYVAGQFTNINQHQRNHLAQIRKEDASPTDWNPQANSHVWKVAVWEDRLYAAGAFTTMGGIVRERIASFNLDDGTLSDWNPGANGDVRALAFDDELVFAGGSFTFLGNVQRQRLGALHLTNGEAADWNPQTNGGSVHTITLTNSFIAVGGDFNGFGGFPGVGRNRVAAFDRTTGEVSPWDPDATGTVFSLSSYDDHLFVAGEFKDLGGVRRNRLAALDMNTGAATEWNPDIFGGVHALMIAGNTLYVGGVFSHVNGAPHSNGIPRERLAAFDISSGELTDWNPGANNMIISLALHGNTLYAGGAFTVIGGENRYCVAAFDHTTGALTNWNPNPNNTVRAVAVKNNTVYLGGIFTEIRNQPRNRIAAVDAVTAELLPWNPDANNAVFTIDFYKERIIAGGNFTRIGGQTRNRLAMIDSDNADVIPWNPNVNNLVITANATDSIVYIAGAFTRVSGQSRVNIAALDPEVDTDILLPWNPGFSGTTAAVNVIQLTDNLIVTGGDFERIQNNIIQNFAVFNPANLVAAAPVSSNTIHEPVNTRVFPNPARNHINIDLSHYINGKVVLEIINLQAQTVFKQERNIMNGENLFSIHVEHLPRGLYILHVTNETIRERVKFLKD